MRKPLFGRARRRPRPLLTSPELDGRRLFLGRFDEEGLRGELEREGILSGLRARGYEDVVVRTSCEDGEHRLRIRSRGGRTSLIDLRLLESTHVVQEEVTRGAGFEVLSVLRNTWLSLQDPRASFTKDRPRLPGQRWPGLGLTRSFYSLMTRWAEQWGKDAVLAAPQHFHNAVFYARAFSFLSPSEQGRFEALGRDLAPLPLAEASAAVEAGKVLDLVTKRPLLWRPGPMAAPVRERLREVFAGEGYRRAAEAAREGARFGTRP